MTENTPGIGQFKKDQVGFDTIDALDAFSIRNYRRFADTRYPGDIYFWIWIPDDMTFILIVTRPGQHRANGHQAYITRSTK